MELPKLRRIGAIDRRRRLKEKLALQSHPLKLPVTASTRAITVAEIRMGHAMPAKSAFVRSVVELWELAIGALLAPMN